MQLISLLSSSMSAPVIEGSEKYFREPLKGFSFFFLYESRSLEDRYASLSAISLKKVGFQVANGRRF